LRPRWRSDFRQLQTRKPLIPMPLQVKGGSGRVCFVVLCFFVFGFNSHAGLKIIIIIGVITQVFYPYMGNFVRYLSDTIRDAVDNSMVEELIEVCVF